MAGVEAEGDVVEDGLGATGIGEADVFELEALADGAGGRDGVGPVFEVGFGREEVKEVLDVEGLFGDVGEAAEDAFHAGAGAEEGSGEEGEITDGEVALDGAGEDVGVGGVVAGGGEEVEEEAGDGFADSEAAIFGVVAEEEGLGAFEEEVAEAEDFDFFGGGDGGSEHAEVVEFAAFGGPAVEEGVGEHGEAGFAPEDGEEGGEEEDEEPAGEGGDGEGDGDEGDAALGEAGELG